MKKFLLFLFLIVICLCGTFVFLFSRTIDEKNYQQQIIEATQELLGRQLQVNGQLSVNLFPTPVITLTDISIANPRGFKNTNLITIEKVEAHIKLMSLLENPLVIENLVLIKPQIFLEKNEKGNTNWIFPFLKPSNRKISQDNLLGQDIKELPPQFQNTEVQEGTLTYVNQPLQQTLVFNNINGQIKADSIKGPFDFIGQLDIRNMPVSVDFHISALGADLETKFNFILTALNSKAAILSQDAKIIRFAEPNQEISGSFALKIPNIPLFVQDFSGYKNFPQKINRRLIGGGKFLFSAEKVVFDDMTLVYGNLNNDVASSGKIVFTSPKTPNDKRKTDISLKFSQLDLDILLPYLPKGTSEYFKTLIDYTKDLSSDVDFSVTCDNATMWNKNIKDLSLEGYYSDQKINNIQLSAILPGQTEFKLQGNIQTQEDNSHADFDSFIKSDNLAPIFEWAKIETPFIQTPKALHDVIANTKIEMTPTSITFKNFDAKIGQGKASGNLSFILPKNQKAAYIQMNFDSLNFDHFVPFNTSAPKRSVKQTLNDVKDYLSYSVLLSDADIKFEFLGNNVTFKDLPIQKFTFLGTVKDKTWTTEKLDISQMATIDLTYSGKIHKNEANTISFEDINFRVDIPKAPIFLERIKVVSPFSPTIGKLLLTGKANGTFENMQISSQLALAQGRIEYNGTIQDILKDLSPFQLKAKVVFPNLTQFVRLFEPTYKGHPNLNGSFSFDGLISYGFNSLTFKDATIAAGPQKATFNLAIQKEDSLKKVMGNITSPWLYLDKFVISSDTPENQYSKELLDFSALENLQLDLALFATKASWENFETNNFETHILLDQKILKIEKTEASVEDGQITFNANLNFSAATPYLKGQLQLKSIPVKPDLLSIVPFYLNKGLASFSADFDAKGNSVDDMMHSLSAQGHFGIQKGVISGMNLQNFERTSQAMIVRADLNKNMATALQRSFFTGETPFEILEGSYAITNGLLRSTDGILNVPNANALLHVDFNLPQKTLSSSAAFSFKNLIGYPPLPLSIKGSIRNPQVNLDLTSFIKYIESSASDTKNEFIRRQREQEIERQQNEAQSRVQQISDLMLSAQKQLELAKKTIQLAPSETAEAQFIRATDAFILLEELSKKSTPSEADVSKAIAQASQIASRTQVAMDEVTERAAGVIRKDIADNFELAQQKMIGINRVYQRLKTVESITKAYQTANAALTEIQQINTVAQTATDVEKLQEASVTVQKDVDIIDSTYKNIQKYDIEANPFYDENTSMQGVITRN